jgi:hypothetical protein
MISSKAYLFAREDEEAAGHVRGPLRRWIRLEESAGRLVGDRAVRTACLEQRLERHLERGGAVVVVRAERDDPELGKLAGRRRWMALHGDEAGLSDGHLQHERA